MTSKIEEINSFLRCEWVFNHEKDGKNYSKCSNCGRIKRSDLPDVQQCVGSSVAHQTMRRTILGQKVTERDIEDMEKSEVKENNHGG